MKSSKTGNSRLLVELGVALLEELVALVLMGTFMLARVLLAIEAIA